MTERCCVSRLVWNTDPAWSCMACGETDTWRRGLRCKKCCLRAWRAGIRTNSQESLDRIFWTRVIVVEEGPHKGCHEWHGAMLAGGYGMLVQKGKHMTAHRHAWALAKGPIPDGMNVLHHCDNKRCVRTDPDDQYPEGHLFLGTLNDNNQDRKHKGGYATGESHYASRLTSEQVATIRAEYPSRRVADLAREYGMSWSGMDAIVKGLSWR